MRTIIPKEITVIPEGAKKVFSGVIYDVYHWEQEMFDGTHETFEMLKRPDSVQILVVEDNKILVQNQQQPNTKSFYSFPGGRHDVDAESELEAAKRELLEESGLVCTDWKLVDVEQPTTHQDRLVYTYVAQNISDRMPPQLDAGEKITDAWMDYEELMVIYKTGRLDCFGYLSLAQLSEVNDLLNIPEYKV